MTERPTWVSTDNTTPPLPIRSHDWTAWDDRLGADASPYGYGETEEAAIADLLEQMEDLE